MAEMTDKEFNELAHSLAFDQAFGIIDGYTGSESAGMTVDQIDQWWQNTSNVDTEAVEAVADAVRYLDARGLIERHPDHPEWVRVRDESEATR